MIHLNKKFKLLSILLLASFISLFNNIEAKTILSPDSTKTNCNEINTSINSEDNSPVPEANIKDTIEEDNDEGYLNYDSLDADNDSSFISQYLRKYPASSLYNGIWSTERLNPYHIKIDSLPDSIKINCSDFFYPTQSNHVTSPFGFRHGRFHYGTDIGLSVGDTVYAVFSGKVRFVTYERHGYGHYVVIRHSNGLESLSAHLSKVLVTENQDVKAGDPIGLGGSTGRSTGPHLHFELRFLGDPFNTAKLIDYDSKSLKHGDNYLITHDGTYSHQEVLKQYAKAKAEARYCVVHSGDTLSLIAHKHGTTVKRLCQLNKIKSTTLLRVGRKIRYK